MAALCQRGKMTLGVQHGTEGSQAEVQAPLPFPPHMCLTICLSTCPWCLPP